MVRVTHVKQHLIEHSVLSIYFYLQEWANSFMSNMAFGYSIFLMSPKLSQRSSSDRSVLADGKCFVNYIEI